MGNYICMRCGEETDEPHFDLVSGTVSCPICLEQDADLEQTPKQQRTQRLRQFPRLTQDRQGRKPIFPQEAILTARLGQKDIPTG